MNFEAEVNDQRRRSPSKSPPACRSPLLNADAKLLALPGGENRPA